MNRSRVKPVCSTMSGLMVPIVVTYPIVPDGSWVVVISMRNTFKSVVLVFPSIGDKSNPWFKRGGIRPLLLLSKDPHRKVGVFCLRRNSGQMGSGEICLGKRCVYIVTTMNTFQTKMGRDSRVFTCCNKMWITFFMTMVVGNDFILIFVYSFNP